MNEPLSALPWYVAGFLLPLALMTVGGVFGSACWLVRDVSKKMGEKDSAFLEYLKEENKQDRQERSAQALVLKELSDTSRSMSEAIHDLRDTMEDMRVERALGK